MKAKEILKKKKKSLLTPGNNGARISKCVQEDSWCPERGSFTVSVTAIKKANKRCVGLRETTKAIENDKAQKVFLAKDAEDKVKIPVEKKCENKDIEVVYVESMWELGRACDIDRGASTAAILK